MPVSITTAKYKSAKALLRGQHNDLDKELSQDSFFLITRKILAYLKEWKDYVFIQEIPHKERPP